MKQPGFRGSSGAFTSLGYGNYGSFPGARLESTQWLFLVPLKGGIGGIVHPPMGSIYCLLVGYIIPTTYYQNLKNPLIYPKVLLKNCLC